MAGLGVPELLLILAAVMLLFGYKKLPDAARSLGQSMRLLKAEVDHDHAASDDARRQ